MKNQLTSSNGAFQKKSNPSYLMQAGGFLLFLYLFPICAKSQTIAFSYTGSVQTYTVAAGVFSLAVDAQGAKGGNDAFGAYGTGGNGGRVQCTLSVTPGQVLYIYTGGTGAAGNFSTGAAGGFNGGGGSSYMYAAGGGGATDIRIGGTALSNRVIVAGGGGGASATCSNMNGGPGGSLTGGNGLECGTFSLSNCGSGGTQTAGGAAASTGGTAGGLGTGGTGASSHYGGGGGAGYYGGGGGYFGGGGGGSSYSDAVLTSGTIYTQGYRASTGLVLISSPMGFISGPTFACVGSTSTFSDATTGGTWSTSSTAIATVGASTGVVGGVAAGTVTITYTVGSSYVTTLITVIAPPVAGPISGPSVVGRGSYISLSSLYSGTWSSSNPSVDSVNGSGGVTGISVGTAIITHAVSNSCGTAIATAIVTVPGYACTPIITSVAGTMGTMSFGGDGGPATAAALNQPYSVAFDGSGNMYIADMTNYRVRKVNSSGIISTFAGNGTSGFSGDGGQATAASFHHPSGVAADAAGNVYVADQYRVRKINSSGIITTVAGSGSSGSTGNGGPATAATLSADYMICDAAGNIYVADEFGYTVRKINTSGIINAFAGTGTAAFSGDGGPATAATLSFPVGLALDASGNLYIADNYTRVRMVNTSGIISTMAGTGSSGYTGDGGPATAAELFGASSIAVDGSGNMYIVAGSNLRTINSSGIINTVSALATGGCHGEGVPLSSAGFSDLVNLGMDASGNLYTLDDICADVRKISFCGLASISGTTTVCAGATTALSDASTGGAWSSSNTSVATVGTGGVVSGVAAGTATIIYTAGSFFVTTTVTVNPTAVISGTATVAVGATTTLSSTTSGGTWSSSNTSVATAGSTGVITGVAAGTSTISYTLSTGCTATAVVTVTSSGGSSAPVISSVSPLSGYPASSVTITGTGFNSTASSNTVFFGATKAIVSSASSTSLNVSVPTSSTYDLVSVTNNSNSLTGYSQHPFLPTYNNSSCVPDSIHFDPLTTQTYYEMLADPQSVAIGDLDGDGKPDLVIAAGDWGHITVLRNTSTAGTLDSNSFTHWYSSQNFGTGAEADFVALADLDGDGKLDVVLTHNSSEVSVFRNTSTSGSISFATQVNFTTGSPIPWGVAISDLDGDGKPDIVVVNSDSNSISILRNTTTPGSITSGSFAAHVEFATGNFPDGVAIGDLDGDGKPDIVVANALDSNVSVFRNTSTPGAITSASFADTVDFATGRMAAGVLGHMAFPAIGDLDGDGKPDIAVGIYYPVNTVAILRNTSTSGSITSGSFAAHVDVAAGNSPTGLAMGDLDGDGKPDIAVSGAGGISVLRNHSTSGSITTSSFTNFNLSSDIINFGLAVGDLDGDNKPDIAVAWDFGPGGYMYVLKNDPLLLSITGTTTVCVGATTTLSDTTGGGTWSSSNTSVATMGTAGTVYGVSAGTTTISYTASGSTATATVTVYASPAAISGTTTVATGSTTTLSDATSGGTWSSSNTSIATAGTGSGIISGVAAGTAVISYALSTGCSATAVVTVTSSGGSSAPVISSVSPLTGHPASAVTITGTGFNSTASSNIVYFGAARATVSAASTTSLSVTLPDGGTYSPVSVTNASNALTGYSRLPFLPTYDNSAYVADTINLDAEVDFMTGSGPASVVISDMDGDGKPDIVTAGGATDMICILRNTSTSGSITSSSFATSVDIATPLIPGNQVVVGDVDGDGKPDIVVAAGYTGVSVFRNTSTPGAFTSGSLATRVDFYTGSYAFGVALGDLDGDGKPDIAATNAYNNTVTVLRNTSTSGSISSGSFATHVDFATGGFPFGVAIGDLDGDGKPDLAVANGDDNTMSVLRNTSTPGAIASGSFASQVVFATGNSPQYPAIGDIDGDGKPDIAVANNGDNTISVLRNTSTTGSITTSSFASKVDFATSCSTNQLAMGDLDGDGKPDLAVAGLCAMTLLRNNCTSGSITTSSFSRMDFSGFTALGGAIGDLDGDGKPDVVVAWGVVPSLYVSVLRNHPLLLPITGTTSVCAGSGTTLSDAATGGTWSSSNTSVATMGTAGTVYGVSAGTTTISYTASGSTATATVTVYATPSAISGALSFCTGSTITLSDATSGGAWSSGNTSVATANSSGVVSGVAAGTTIISYSVGSCYAMTTVTVISAGSISGTASVTAGSTTTLTDAITGGTWSSSDVTIATVSSGVVGGVAAGTATISYTVGGCYATTVVTVATSGGGGGLAPVILSLSSSAGIPSSPLTITGMYFNPAASADIVYFGATPATVTSASSTSLVVTIPAGASYEPVSVTNTAVGLTGYSQYAFLPTFDNTAYIAGIVNFSAKVDFTSATNPWAVAIADVDGDNKADLIVANNGANSISVYRNTCTSGAITAGSFATKVDFTTGTTPNSVTTGDINGDGKLDIIVTNYGSNTVSVFRNTATTGTIDAGSLAAKVDFATGTNPMNAAAGDIDGDGKPDLAVANYYSNTLSLLRNACSGSAINSSSFAAKVDFTASLHPYYVALGDIDGDQKQDVIVVNNPAATVSVFRNTATAGAITGSSLAGRVDFATGTAPCQAAIGDIDGDGKPDIVVTNSTGNSVSVLRNTASAGSITTGSLAAKVDFATGGTPYCVSLGDADGDGKVDIVVANSSSNTISVLRNRASAGAITSSSLAARVDFATGAVPRFVAVGDLDGDGIPDAVTTNYSAGTISVLRNNPLRPITGTNTVAIGSTTTLTDLTSGGTWSSGATAVATVAAGVVSGVTAGTAIISYTVAGGSATDTVFVSGVSSPACLPAVTSVSPTAGFPASSVTIAGSGFNTTMSNNIVYFGATQATVTSASATSLSVTVPNGATYYPVTVENTGCALTGYARLPFLPTFDNTAFYVDSIRLTAKVDFTSNTNPYNVAIGDIDGDGQPDIVVSNYGAAKISVYRNTSSGDTLTASSFAAKVDFITGTSPYGLAIGDLDNDGKLDIAVTNYGSAPPTVSVFRNTATSGSITSSSLAAKVDFTVGTGPIAVAICDFDKDGKADLAVANNSANTVSILHNVGSEGSVTTSTFATKVDFTAGTHPFGIAAGDLDGDGKPDLAVPNQAAGTVSVFRNTSVPGTINSSSFAAKVDFTTGSQPYGVAIGDIDGDGKPDLVVPNNGAASVSVLRNTATSGSITSGSFAAKVDFTTGSGPYSVALADMNGDGKPEMIVANRTSNTVSIFRNTATSGSISSGSFFTKKDYATGSAPVCVAACDLDADGRPDVVTANIAANTVSVLKNWLRLIGGSRFGTGQETSSAFGDITVIPNPNKGTFIIKGSLADDKDQEVTIEIADMLGQVIYRNKATATSGQVNEQVQLDNSIANGMYLLSLKSESENKTFHIVVSR